MTEKIKCWCWLAGVNLFISTFTFGGGYVVVPMVRKYFIEKTNRFNEDELMDMAAIAQSTPGAIAINLSALAGYRVAGVAGVVISSIAAVVPPLIILAFVSSWYAAFASNRTIAAVLLGMQAGVVALIIDLVVDMSMMILKEKSLLLTCMIPLAFVGSFIFHINVSVILILSCFVCILKVLYQNKRRILL